jgi:hypothetical protein
MGGARDGFGIVALGAGREHAYLLVEIMQKLAYRVATRAGGFRISVQGGKIDFG